MAEAPVIARKIDEPIQEKPFIPTKREAEIVASVWEKFRRSRDNRNGEFEFFDGRSLLDYIEDNVRRFVTNTDEREDIEDWQARVFDPFTRNKIIAILGKVAAAIPKPEFFAVGDEDVRRASILNDLYQHADRQDDTDELMFYALLEAAVKGTVVGYEGYEEKERDIRDIAEYKDGIDITLKKGKIITRKLKGSIVPLEDFYPSNVGIRKIEDMPFCFWRTILDESEFKMSFAQYPSAALVNPFLPASDEEDRPFYRDYISDDVTEGKIEVVRYYNQDTDEYIILANGVWLNPFKGNAVMPLPWAHKKLPFWHAIYEPYGEFFYGKSIPDKLKSSQDVINVLHNMMLDQSFLSIFPPILTEGFDEFEDDFLRPGRVISVNDASGTRELQISTPSGFHQFILEFTKGVLEESSIDAVSQGIAGVGDRVTAREIQQAAEGVEAVLGLFAQFIKWGVRDKARLRAKNILQFYNKPMLERILGEGGSEEFSGAFNTFKIEDTVLTSGKRGTRIIEMFASRDDFPTRGAIQAQAGILEEDLGVKVEKIVVNPDYIRDFEFDVRLTPNPQAGESKALRKALMLEFTNVALAGFPELVDKENLFAEISSLFGFRPEKFLKKQEPQQDPLAALGGGNEGPGGAGNLGVGANLRAGLTSGDQGGRAIRDIT